MSFDPADTVGLTTMPRSDPTDSAIRSLTSASGIGVVRNVVGVTATPSSARSARYRLSVFQAITAAGLRRSVTAWTRSVHSMNSRWRVA